MQLRSAQGEGGATDPGSAEAEDEALADAEGAPLGLAPALELPPRLCVGDAVAVGLAEALAVPDGEPVGETLVMGLDDAGRLGPI